jgi:hypothetical protein
MGGALDFLNSWSGALTLTVVEVVVSVCFIYFLRGRWPFLFFVWRRVGSQLP